MCVVLQSSYATLLSIACLVGEVVHSYELFREVFDFHVHVLWTCHGCHEVEIFEVNGAVACTLG